MTTMWRALALAVSVVAVVLVAPTTARAQTGTMALSAPFFTNPLGDFPPPGSFFDPYGPVPVFLDHPITRAELNLFYRGRLRVPRNRPYTFDPFLGPRGTFQGQGFFNFPAGPTGFSNGLSNGGFFNFPPGFRGQLPSVLPGNNAGLHQVAPGMYFLPGREPGAFGRFQAPLATPFRR
jgi:hypothetical protein